VFFRIAVTGAAAVQYRVGLGHMLLSYIFMALPAGFYIFFLKGRPGARKISGYNNSQANKNNHFDRR
jgi:hypothetical protein